MRKESQQKGRLPVIVFYSYAHEDEALLDQLKKHLSDLRHQGFIAEWYDRQILPGMDWAGEIHKHLNEAHLVLLLISAEFLASDYCYGIEANIALERHDRGLCRVIPVLLRPTDWENSRFARLQYLPGKKAVTQYENRDEAFREIAKGIRKAIERLKTPAHLSITVDSKMRQQLLRRVRTLWIEGYLGNSLHDAALLALGLQEQPDAIANPWRMVVQELERPARSLPRGTKILDVFEQAEGHLLILGEPGAGKTTLLLELACDLLDRAKQDASQPVPVVLLLSTWTQQRQALSGWMVGELEAKYGVPPEIAQALVKGDQILPLLDGFDEVAEDHRASCLAAINAYQKTCPSVSMVVCSRKYEYDVQATLLALENAVYIQPLTQEQIDVYLESAGSHLEVVRRALHEDAGLQQLATTPLWLSVLTLAYQGISVEDILGAPLEKQRRLIFEKYVERMLTRGSQARYTAEQIKCWLAWLAKQMKKHDLTAFSLMSIKADWFETPSMRLAKVAGSQNSIAAVGVVGISVIAGWLAGGPIVSAILGTIAGVGISKAGRIGEEVVLKKLLWKAGVGPKNYTDFLNYAVDHILLRKVGEDYIFVHQLLLDYFASLAGPPALYDTSSIVN
jgi:hypothetical protein